MSHTARLFYLESIRAISRDANITDVTFSGQSPLGEILEDVLKSLSKVPKWRALDSSWAEIYIVSMFRRAVGTSLLAAWFVLSGIVFSESLGFVDEPPDMNGSVEVWLASFGGQLEHPNKHRQWYPCLCSLNRGYSGRLSPSLSRST